MAACPNIMSICSGVGLIDLGIKLAVPGSRTVCYLEREAPACRILAARMREGLLDPAPIWSDLTTFDARPWRGVVDILAGGIPCQPFSVAGKQLGNTDERALAEHVVRIVEACRPAVVFIENVPPWVSRGYAGGFCEALCRLGYTVEDPLFLAASSVGAPHRRERVFVLAHADGVGLQVSWHAKLHDEKTELRQTGGPRSRRKDVANADGAGLQDIHDIGRACDDNAQVTGVERCCGDWWFAEPGMGRMAYGLPNQLDRIRALGNGAVPLVVAIAFRELIARAERRLRV